MALATALPPVPSAGVSMSSCPERLDILLVDDQPPNLLALEAILGDLGHNLVRAGSGAAARERHSAAAARISSMVRPGSSGTRSCSAG